MRYIGKNLRILLSVSVMLATHQLSQMAIPSTSSAAAISETALENTASAARYMESDHSWTLSAKVVEIKDVSIYGRPGSIARIEYLRTGKPKLAWAAVKIDDYSFIEGTDTIVEGEEITLQLSGAYVSSRGVDWKACPRNDLYCQNASYIEGGFPQSEDFDGLTISPSNMLIHWGSVDANDWINGILAWKISASKS